mmetsp:Transcript_22047/g.39060  ORF Transcript_22047/g.39060 Transcript_22047/m.39060 type:complete len:218 (+) Transcript_22047:774-1427(+)
MLGVGDGKTWVQLWKLLHVYQFQLLRLVHDGVDAHAPRRGHARHARWHVRAVEGEGVQEGVAAQERHRVRDAPQPAEGGAVQVAREQHRRLLRAVLPGEAGQFPQNLPHLPRTQEVLLGVFRVALQVRADEANHVPSHLDPQQDHERDAIFPTPLRDGIVFVDVLTAMFCYKFEDCCLPCNAAAISAGWPWALLPDCQVAHGLERRPEEIVEVVTLH